MPYLMNITSKDLLSKRRVGYLKNAAVIEVITKGGLHLLVMAKGAGVEVLGTGPHRAVARHIASKRHSEIVFTDLAKSEEYPEWAFQHYIPEYEVLTDRLLALWK